MITIFELQNEYVALAQIRVSGVHGVCGLLALLLLVFFLLCWLSQYATHAAVRALFSALWEKVEVYCLYPYFRCFYFFEFSLRLMTNAS